MTDIVERLRAPFAVTDQDAQEAVAEIERLREENARLREALEPFATAAYSDVDSTLDLLHAICSLTFDDFRRARTAIQEGDKNVK